MKRYMKYVVAAMLFAALFCGYFFAAGHVLYFHEQHHLFRWTAEYWATMSATEGWSYPLMAFVVQFGYYPALGAAVWALLLTLEYLMLQSIVYRLTGVRDLLQLTVIPVAWLFSTTVCIDVLPSAPVEWAVWTFGVWVLAMVAGRFLPWRRKAAAARPAGAWERRLVWASPVLALALGAAGFSTWSKDKLSGLQHDGELMMLTTERAVRERRWGDALELGNKWAATGHKNHLMSYFRALALYHTGGLYEHLLDYPQTFGIRSLFFPWRGDKNQAEYGHYVYHDLGHISEAHRWVFEAMVGWHETAPLLNYLVEYNIAMGRPRVADKFLLMLEQSTFYRERARYLRKCLEQGSVPGVRWALAGVPSEPARWNNVINIGGEASFVAQNDPGNEMARQYLTMSMLLVGNGDAVLRSLQRYYPADSCRELPRVLQEALLMYRLSYGHAAIDALGYSISPENEQRFRDYMKESKKGREARYTPDQRRSYWYYVQHVLPKVNHDFSRTQAQVQS